MYNAHPYFSLKNLDQKCALYMAKYGMCHICLNQSPIKGGHFGCFRVLATVNDAAVNVGVRVSLQINVFKFWG